MLYRNRGDGTFADVTEAAGVADPGYSSAAAFFDYDADGDLDLWVVHYLNWSPGIERSCFSRGRPARVLQPARLRPPAVGHSVPQRRRRHLHRRQRARRRSRRGGHRLGIVTADFDGDGRVDVYVANDQMPNNLWLNRGDGTFADEGLVRGCALDETGRPQASMGVVTEDVEDDGDWDLFSVNLTGEGAAFHRNLGGGHFVDATDELRLGSVTQPYTGFGTALFDFDDDGRLDVFVANGKVRLGDALEESYAEPKLLLRGSEDGGFDDVSARAGPAFALPEVSRAAAFGDYDNDGDVDVLVANNNGPARLLRNEAPHPGGHFLSVALRGKSVDRDGIGAVVVVRTGERARRRQVQPAWSYAASNDPRLHFGLGTVGSVDEVTVIWPDGRRQTKRDVAADQFLVFEEPARAETSIAVPTEEALAGAAAAVTATSAPRSLAPLPTEAAPRIVPRPPPGAALDPEVAASIAAAVAAVEAEPEDGKRWGSLGRVYESAEYFTLARTCYQAARGLDSTTAEWPYHLGRLAAQRGEPEAAASYFTETLRLDQGSTPARLRLGQVELRRGDVVAAEDAYTRVVTDQPLEPWGYVGLARVRQRQGRVGEARELLVRALAVEPRDREGAYLLALLDSLEGRGGDAAARIESFATTTSTQWPPDPWLDRVDDQAVGVQVVLRRANSLLAAGDLDAAQPLYEGVLASDPDEVAALVNLGNVHLRRRDGRRALPLFERAVELEPADPHPRLGLAMALIAAGQRDRGVAELDRVLLLDPENAQARAMREAARTAR